MNYKNNILTFEIHQKGNPNTLKVKLPIFQDILECTKKDQIACAFNFLDKSKKQTGFPLYNIHGFSIVKVLKTEKKFLVWFSPEKLLQNWWKGIIKCDIIGDFRSFLKYKVLYVGKATKQSIFKRLTGHETFQDILTLQTPVTEMQLPANEIVILPFEFQDNLEFQTFDNDDSIKSMASVLMGEKYPSQTKVFLDAEKALINAIKPSYNKELFKNYPISKDGLYEDNYDYITYTFIDPITLVYDEGEICGGLSEIGGDSILIKENKELELLKYKVN